MRRSKRRIEIDASLRIKRQGIARGPRHYIVNIDVCRSTRGQRNSRVGSGQLRTQGRPRNIAATGRHREVSGINQPATRKTLRCNGADARAIGNLYAGRTRFDKSAVTALRGRCIQGARQRDCPSLHTTEQHNAARLGGHAARLHYACVVDDAGQHTIAGARTQKHLTPIGLNQACIGGERVQLAGLYLQA